MTAADPACLRRQVCSLLIVAATAMAVGRILATERVYEPSLHRADGDTASPRSAWPVTRPAPMPTFSSNDRSRWATVRSLVDEGTYVVGRRDLGNVLASGVAVLSGDGPLQLAVLFEAGYRVRAQRSDSGIVFEDGWQTVDKVLQPARLEFYSSKPPLLSTLVAGPYWLLEKLTGWTLKDRPQEVVRCLLLLLNALPFAVYLWLLARLLERYGGDDWARLFVLACAAFGTLVTPFLITFNNHTVAAFSALFAVAAVLRIWDEPHGAGRRAWPYLLAGLAAGFAATNELPALSLTAGLGLVLLWRDPRRTLLLYAPAALLPLAALLGTNYLALGQWRPAYSEFGGPWYEYEGSHWRAAPGQVKRGIDWAARYEGRATYAFHLLLGHHGLFSLSPVLFLTVAGVVLGLRARPSSSSVGQAFQPDASVRQAGKPDLREEGGEGRAALPAWLYALTAGLSLLVIGFYLVRSDNYGGFTSGPRWLMWLWPLWLLCLLPAVERLGRRRWGRLLCLALLGLSVLSASYPAWNPWRHPWIYNWLDAHGLIPY
jgi:hypothetical protein